MEASVSSRKIGAKDSVVPLKDPVVMEVISSPEDTKEVDWGLSSEVSLDSDPDTVDLFDMWSRLEDKCAGKSFLRTLQPCPICTGSLDDKTYCNIIVLLMNLTRKNVRFKWTSDCSEDGSLTKEDLVKCIAADKLCGSCYLEYYSTLLCPVSGDGDNITDRIE